MNWLIKEQSKKLSHKSIHIHDILVEVTGESVLYESICIKTII